MAIEVYYNHQSRYAKTSWVSGSQRFRDYEHFAQWLTQTIDDCGAVLITSITEL